MSKIAPPLPPFERKKHNDPIIEEIRYYQVITPIYGGGVEAGSPDPITPIRVPTIRGHLRFWWRATQGARYPKPKELYKHESAIFGSTEAQSKLHLHVEMTKQGETFLVNDSRGNTITNLGHFSSPYSYAAFPAFTGAGGKDFQPPYNHEFKLTLRYPSSLKKDIEAALWAWSCFGWVGARGRRGFGALRLLSVNGVAPSYPHEPQALLQRLQEELDRHCAETKEAKDYPTLYAAYLYCTGAHNKAEDSWKNLLEKYKNFRQMRNRGERPPRPGRSKWPEPDAIRALTRRSSPRHSTPLLQINGRTILKFPRARFGLPIIFQFIDRREGDPNQTELSPQGYDRLASPLILRPFHTGQKVIGVVVILDSPFPFREKLEIRGVHGTQSAAISEDEAKKIEPLGGKKNILKAFLTDLGYKS